MDPEAIRKIRDHIAVHEAKGHVQAYFSIAGLKTILAELDKEHSGPDGFYWINEPVLVTGNDYEYEGQLLLSFPKGDGGGIRYVVLDQNKRLFIHNAKQCGFEESK
jgi:hypothetical protein